MAVIPENPDDEGDLKRALGPWHLISLGIGCIIGAGIFVLTGHAAAGYAGPGVVISFAIAGLGCLFAGLCYSEYASMIPVAGSAYTYTYATMGRLLAWIIGWNLVLEYLAAHEVAHFIHMNHSPAFWKVTHRLFPETDRAEEWLKTHGPDLHRFGAKKA